MEHLFQRGTKLAGTIRITKLLSEGDEWAIYSTDSDSNVLAINQALYNYWCEKFRLQDSPIFIETDIDLFCFFGKRGYLVSSLEWGPYPCDSSQIDAFADAFGSFQRSYPNEDLTKALYIEEYSMILPIHNSQKKLEPAVVFGRWISGGVGVSIESIDRISNLAPWLPKGAIEKAACTAGFDVQKPYRETDCFRLPGRPALERFFTENILDIVTHREEYARMGIEFPGATILYGPPGSGKTFAVDKLAEFLGWSRFNIDSSTIASPYIHETGRKVSEVFTAAIEAAPSILVIDEMEAYLSDREMSSHGGHHVEEVAEFLRRIPEAVSKGVLVFAMTNLIEAIDPAVLRRGRFDHIVEVGMASKEEIEELLNIRFRELPVDPKVNTCELAAKLEGRPLSDIVFAIREAGRLAVSRELNKIDVCCFEDALNRLSTKTEKTSIGFHT